MTSPLTELQGIAVTGALGNLGRKLLHHFAAAGVPRLVGLDLRQDEKGFLESLRAAAPGAGVEARVSACDLADPDDARWRAAFEQVDVVIHLAAQNPYPEATWGDATASLDMTLNTALAAVDSPAVRRYVLATSNHVMGRYLEDFVDGGLPAGALTTDRDPGVGTVWDAGGTQLDSSAYAAAKWAGERLCRALARRSGGATTFAALRIGWCQPGDNRPETLNASGTPTQARARDTDGEVARIGRWFREMWLANQDLTRLFDAAVTADGTAWPAGFALVNGMSANAGMAWDLEAGRRLLGYEPRADVYAEADPAG